MLIRSQDKRMIVNFDNICTVSAFPEKDSEDIYVEDGTGSLMIGRYSTKVKAMKVLDMIQEAYAEYKTAENMSTGLTSAIYTRHYASEEEINKLLTLSKEIARILKEAHIFQMPEDSEVEV